MRKSGIVLDAGQTSELNALADSPDEELAKRARIVLKLGEGRSIRAVAETEGTDKNTVSKWKGRFLKGGVQALASAHGGGRAPADGVADLQGEIRRRIDTKGIEHWTKRSLAEDIGVDESRVGRELGRMGVTLDRRTRWEFPARSGAETRCSCLAGVFLSPSERCVVVCTAESPIEGAGGTVVTRSRRLAGALSGADGDLTLADALWTAADHAGDPGRRSPKTMASFLSDVALALPSGPGFGLHAVALAGDSPAWRGKAPIGLTMSVVGDAGAWDAAASSLLGQFGPSAVSPVLAGIGAFCDSCLQATEPFVWVRGVVPSGAPDVAAAPPASAGDPLAEALSSAVGGATDGDEMDCKMVVVVRAPSGLEYKVVDAPKAFPGAGSFSFSSTDGLMAGFDEMEDPMVALRNEAGRSAAEMFVSAAKKNCIRAASAAR